MVLHVNPGRAMEAINKSGMMAFWPESQALQPMPSMGDILPDTLQPTSVYEGLLVWSKGLVWHAGNTGVWLGRALCTKNWHFFRVNTPTRVSSMQMFLY
eukprot:1159558-Pelagomonas_calceolata.AAC.5